MSSRDPSWMSPLVRSMLRAKTRISLNNRDRLKLADSRISQVISKSRRNPASMVGKRRPILTASYRDKDNLRLFRPRFAGRSQ